MCPLFGGSTVLQSKCFPTAGERTDAGQGESRATTEREGEI